jgi:uncharacterized protein (TIGR03083 family)
MSDLSKARLVPALQATWSSLIDLCGRLGDADWEVTTECPGWTVRDNVAHVVGTESMLLGRPQPTVDVPPYEHVHNPIGEFNESWVEAYRQRSPAEVLADLVEVTGARSEQLAAMSEDEFAAESWTPAGQSTYSRFMRIRVFDCWLHEQDIRRALGRPGAQSGLAAEAALDEVVEAMGYIVGKKGGAPDGSTVVVEVIGPTARTITVHVDGRARVVDEAPGAVTATVRLPLGEFMALAGGRADPLRLLDDGTVEVAGDVELATRVASNLAFTI